MLDTSCVVLAEMMSRWNLKWVQKYNWHPCNRSPLTRPPHYSPAFFPARADLLYSDPSAEDRRPSRRPDVAHRVMAASAVRHGCRPDRNVPDPLSRHLNLRGSATPRSPT